MPERQEVGETGKELLATQFNDNVNNDSYQSLTIPRSVELMTKAQVVPFSSLSISFKDSQAVHPKGFFALDRVCILYQALPVLAR